MLTILTLTLLTQSMTPPPLVSVDTPVAAAAAPAEAVTVRRSTTPDERSSFVAAGVTSIAAGITAAFFAPTAVAGRFNSSTAVFGLLNLIPGMPIVGLLVDALSMSSGSNGILGNTPAGPVRGVLLNSMALVGQGVGAALLAAQPSRPTPSGVQVTGVHVGADTVGLVGRF